MKNETQAIEFKQSWHDEYLEWICGYANAYGGTLYIGRADDGTPVGVAKAKSLMESIPCKACPAYLNLKGGSGYNDGSKGKGEVNREDKADKREDNADNKTLVINAIARNSRLTVRQLAAELPISKATVERVLKALQEAGKLRRIGGTRGVWKIIG